MKTNIEIINDMIKHFEKLDIVKSEDIPDISLYMDQMTSFIDEKLTSFKKEEDDKLLTKTMINNYTKNKLLPPSDKKKYTKNHVMLLILIYFYKNVLSFADIKRLCDLSIYNSFDKGDESLSELYDILVHIEDDKKNEIVDDLKERLEYLRPLRKSLKQRIIVEKRLPSVTPNSGPIAINLSYSTTCSLVGFTIP